MLSSFTKRLSSTATVIILAVLIAAYLGVTYALMKVRGLPPAGQFGLNLGLGLALIAATLVLSIKWWRGKDEAQQEAQKWAWYWGASFGLPVLVPIVLGLVFDHARGLAALLAALRAPGDTATAFVLGIIAALAPMCLGAVVAWIVWWRRHR